jgi:hypothetical protein
MVSICDGFWICNKKHNSTHIKIEKISNLFPGDIDRREQGCAAQYEQVVNKTCNNIVDNLFIVGNTTFLSISTEVVNFMPVHILYRGQQ